jgi:ABC-type sugar transport system permease subunit
MIHRAAIAQSISWVFANDTSGINHFASKQNCKFNHISWTTTG